jgi:hypothetical protein
MNLVMRAELGYFVEKADDISYAGTSHETEDHPLPRARFERRFVWLLNNTAGHRDESL